MSTSRDELSSKELAQENSVGMIGKNINGSIMEKQNGNDVRIQGVHKYISRKKMRGGSSITHKAISIFLVLLLLFTILASPNVEASSKYIKVSAFIKEIVIELDLVVKGTSSKSYLNAAIDAGLVKEKDFESYCSYLTRTDAAVLLNRVDEYLYEKAIEDKLIDTMIEKRISDINKVAKSKREAVASIMAKGIIKGYSNGYYIQNRAFKGSSKITKTGALEGLNLVLNPEKRAKISYDGMLIRTTDLPKNAKDYDYILACYPNKFYEKQFEFMLYENVDWRTISKDVYSYPSGMKNWKFKNNLQSWDFTIERDKHIDQWTAMVEEYLKLLFNVDYRTVNEEWAKKVDKVLIRSQYSTIENIKTYYYPAIKKHKVIIESKIIAVEPSTIYFDNGYCMRAYVKYRIKAKSFPTEHNQLIYSRFVLLDNLKSGAWREGIFDIRFGSTNGHTGDGSSFIMDSITFFVDEYNKPIK